MQPPESPLTYVTHQRLTYAQELLATSPLGIGHIARELGYGSLAHFSGQFRRFAQCAPSVYRQQLLSTAEEAAQNPEAPNSAS